MEPCYEFLGCNKVDCIMHGREDDTACWEVEGTLCSNSAILLARETLDGKKEDICAHCGCIYYTAAKQTEMKK